MTKMQKLENKLEFVKECNEQLQNSLRLAQTICLKLKYGKPLTEKEMDFINRYEDYVNNDHSKC